MGMQTKLVEGTLVVLAAWGAPQIASACSYVPQCSATPTLALVGDVTARPLNGCVGVRYAQLEWYREPIVAELAYVSADGTRIRLAASETQRVYCPTEMLAPDTDYVLVGPELDSSSTTCEGVDEVELLSFHTGSTADTTPPSAPGLVEDAECFRDVCDSSACCGPYDVIAHRSTWGDATDDGAEVAYVVDGVLRTFAISRWAEGLSDQPLPVPAYERLPPHDVRAIDVAGNIGEAAMHGEPCVPAPLEPDAGVPDAFTPSAPDASTGTSPDAAMSSGGGGGGGGCAIVSRVRGGSVDLVVFVMLTLLAPSRRRRGARRDG